MSKTLVIKGANYSANALDVVDFSGVPCTGLALNKAETNLSETGATETLVATATPVDTTDAVRWVSSDPGIVTVDGGVITAVSIGTATITATCGMYSASCTVHCAMSYNANNKSCTNGYEHTGVDMTANPPIDFVGLYGAQRARVYGDNENTLGGYQAYHVTSSLGVNAYPLPIPNGVTKISFSFPTAFVRIYVALMSSAELPTASYSYGCARVLYYTGPVTVSNGKYELTLPDNVDADSFVFAMRTPSEAASGITGDVIVSFS